MICPKCGCNQVTTQVITLCGLCGMGKGKTKITSTQSVVHVCQNCGYHF